MGVKVKKRNGGWWVFVNYQGRRKAKKVGTEKAAKEVAAKIQAKLALGDFGFLQDGDKEVPTFEEYAKKWLEGYVALECKPSTAYSYEQLLRLHVTPKFGKKQLNTIT